MAPTIWSYVIGAAYAATIVAGVPPAWAGWALAFGCTACSVALFVVGAASRGPLHPAIRTLLAVLFVLILAAFGVSMSIESASAGVEPLFLGLPMRLAILFYGIGVVPLVGLLLAPFAIETRHRELPQ